MKYFLSFLILISFSKSYSQGSCGFYDDRNFFYTYTDGNIVKQEIVKIDTFIPSLNYVVYIDQYLNLKLVYKKKNYTLFPTPPQSLKSSNYLLAYMLGSQLGVFNQKQSKKVESFIKGEYKLGDSVLAFVDNYDMLKVYVFDTVYTLNNWSVDSTFNVSSNMVVFETQNSKLKAFYQGQIFTLEDYFNGNYSLNQDLVVYNDNTDNFKVFYKGQVQQLESYPVTDYDITNSAMCYTNNFSEWVLFANGRTKRLLSTAPKFKFFKRNVIAYADNSDLLSVIYKGKPIPIENYIPKKMDAWDDLFVYQDNYGTLWGIFKGVKIQISKGIVMDWELQNECVIYYDLTPNIKTVWNQGKLYSYSSDTNSAIDSE